MGVVSYVSSLVGRLKDLLMSMYFQGGTNVAHIASSANYDVHNDRWL